ncbi:MAG: TolC family protein [Pirellulales bacterium]
MAVLLEGCASYQPMPLTRQGVTEKLAPPDMGVVSLQTQRIVHPILKPIHFDFGDGLSPDEAAILAVLVNPALRSERDRRGTACAQLLQARLLPNPQFTYSADFPTAGIAPDTVNAFGFGLNWDVSELISHTAKVDAASLQPKMVVLDIAWKEWQVAESAKIAVYRKLSLIRETALARETDQRLRDNLTVIRKAINKGLTTELVLAAAETASNQAHANLVDLQRQTDEQSVALNLILGLPAETEVATEANTVLPDHLEPPAAAVLLADLDQRRLDLIALRYGYGSQEATVRAAILGQFPKVNLGVTQSRDNTGVVATGFGVSVGIPIFDHNQGHIAQEQATRQTLFDEYVNRVFEARSDVVKYLTEIRWLNAQIKTAKDAVPSLQRLVDTYRTAVDAGQADVLSYYTAWNDLTQKRIDILKFQQQLVEARISLELATGMYQVPYVTPAPQPEMIPPFQPENTGAQR